MRQTSTRTTYRNAWMTVREDAVEYADGTGGIYGVVEKPDFAVVVPQREDGRICLVEQYRYPIGRRCWELPQGAWPAGGSGAAVDLAATELREETGLTASRYEHLGRLHPVYGFCTFAFDAFLATGLTEGQPEREHSEQDMVHAWFTEAELLAMVRSGEVVDGTTVSTYALLQLHRGAFDQG